MTSPTYTRTPCRQCGHPHVAKPSGSECRYEWCQCESWSRKERGEDRKGAYKFTRSVQAAYCELLKDGIGRCNAAAEVGVDIKTVEREVAKGDQFAAERNLAETRATDTVEESFFQSAISGNVPAAIKWLETKRPDVWAPKKEALPGSSPATPLYVAPGQIDWDAIPDDLAERYLGIHNEILALQPASGGLVVDQDGRNVD